MTERFFAHTMPGAPEAEWEPLDKHLEKVADLAARFAAAFDAEEWVRIPAHRERRFRTNVNTDSGAS